MVRPHSSKLTLAALLLLAAAVAILSSLGRWQLQRADERRAILASIEAGRAQPALALTADTPVAQLTAWRPAQARGLWLADKSVLLENRNHEGKPGYWLATPLLLDAGRHTAVLVLRGWLPRVMPGQGELRLPVPLRGEQNVSGELATHVPRLFELWGAADSGRMPTTLPLSSGATPMLQNLDVQNFADATGLTMLPTVLTQTQGNDELVRDWPQPSVDFNQNLGYAMQWFAFAAMAAIAWLVAAARAWLRWRRRAGSGLF